MKKVITAAIVLICASCLWGDAPAGNEVTWLRKQNEELLQTVLALHQKLRTQETETRQLKAQIQQLKIELIKAQQDLAARPTSRPTSQPAKDTKATEFLAALGQIITLIENESNGETLRDKTKWPIKTLALKSAAIGLRTPPVEQYAERVGASTESGLRIYYVGTSGQSMKIGLVWAGPQRTSRTLTPELRTAIITELHGWEQAVGEGKIGSQ